MSATYVLKHDLYDQAGKLLMKAGATVGLFDRWNGRLLTDLDNWTAPPPPGTTPPTGLVHGTDPAPAGFIWSFLPGRGRGTGSWVLTKDTAYVPPVATTPTTAWTLTPEEQARQQAAHDALARTRTETHRQQQVAKMIGAPVKPKKEATLAPGAMPKQWMPAKWKTGRSGGRNI